MLNYDKDLKTLGKFIPKTLKIFHLKFREMVDFKESLRCFLEGYVVCNSGSLNHLEFKHDAYYYINLRNGIVSEQFGIQIIEWICLCCDCQNKIKFKKRIFF